MYTVFAWDGGVLGTHYRCDITSNVVKVCAPSEHFFALLLCYKGHHETLSSFMKNKLDEDDVVHLLRLRTALWSFLKFNFK